MSHPRIEEVSDSDPEIDDPSDFAPNEVMRRADGPPPKNPTLLQQPPPAMPPAPQYREPTEQEVRAKRQELKPYITLYPVYFSASRTRMSGRRVSKSLACENPLAFNMLKATRIVLGQSIKIAFEPDKTHPKDWSNPGRVKVELFDKENGPLHPTIRNKQHLFNLVAKHMKENPTQREDPLELKLQGLPVPENFLDTKIAVPRGWKMNDVLPVHSAAVTGGGVSDNFFKDAMEEMAAMQGQGGIPGAPGGMDMGAMAQMMQNMGMGGQGGGGGAIASSSKKKDKKK